MSVARSSASLEAAAPLAAPAYGFWLSAFESLSPLSRGHGAWSRMARDSRDATHAAAQHWRALAEMQMAAAGEAFNATLKLAASQAEHRREALTHVMETLWPAAALTPAKEEAARG